MSARLADDPQARALLSELTTTKRWLAGNEPVFTLPEYIPDYLAHRATIVSQCLGSSSAA